MKLCVRNENGEPCVYAAFEKMIGKMKEHVAERQDIGYEGQVVVAKIYHMSAAVLAEACRRKFDIKRAECEPSREFKSENLTLDVFILLKQLLEEDLIDEEYKKTLFEALIEINPEIEKMVKGEESKGFI